MRMKHVMMITLLMVLAATAVGLHCKSKYKDFNEEESPLDNFNVATMPKDFLEKVLDGAEEQLYAENIILAVTCEETTFFRAGCTTEKVKIQKIFKGEGLKPEDEIEIAREGTCTFMSEEMRIAGKPSINMGFVNQMTEGKSYLIFLDGKLTSMDGTEIYLQPQDMLLAPIFCYENLESYPVKPISEDSNYVEYITVKESEFFFSSQEDIDRMQKFKAEILAHYPLEE